MMQNKRLFSPSGLLKTPARYVFDYLVMGEERYNYDVSENMVFGTCVHDACQERICIGRDIKQVIKNAVTDFDFSEADTDFVKRDKYRECLPGAIEQGCAALKGLGFEKTEPEKEAKVSIKGVDSMVRGFVDFYDLERNRIVEMKTKAPRKTKVLKDGTQGWSRGLLPKVPDTNHVMQVSFYAKALECEPIMVYVAEHDVEVFTKENCDELKQDFLDECFEELSQRAKRIEAILSISDNPKDLVKIIDPDWQHNYQWNIGDEYLKKAKEYWKQ